jgi:hypothetical protein
LNIREANMNILMKYLLCSAVLAGSFVLGTQWNQYRHSQVSSSREGMETPGRSSSGGSDEYIPEDKPALALNERSEKLLGPWVLNGQDWGFVLYNDGYASSVNSATLVYHKWRIKDGLLCLTSRSIGNHTQSVDEGCSGFRVEGEPAEARLILNDGYGQTVYRRP